jgi:hypothetical protein
MNQTPLGEIVFVAEPGGGQGMVLALGGTLPQLRLICPNTSPLGQQTAEKKPYQPLTRSLTSR